MELKISGAAPSLHATGRAPGTPFWIEIIDIAVESYLPRLHHHWHILAPYVLTAPFTALEGPEQVRLAQSSSTLLRGICVGASDHCLAEC